VWNIGITYDTILRYGLQSGKRCMIKGGSALNIDIAVLDTVLFSYFWLDIQSVKE